MDETYGRITAIRLNYEDASKHLFQLQECQESCCGVYFSLCPRPTSSHPIVDEEKVEYNTNTSAYGVTRVLFSGTVSIWFLCAK
jgi:hypothetical protein